MKTCELALENAKQNYYPLFNYVTKKGKETISKIKFSCQFERSREQNTMIIKTSRLSLM